MHVIMLHLGFPLEPVSFLIVNFYCETTGTSWSNHYQSCMHEYMPCFTLEMQAQNYEGEVLLDLVRCSPCLTMKVLIAMIMAPKLIYYKYAYTQFVKNNNLKPFRWPGHDSDVVVFVHQKCIQGAFWMGKHSYIQHFIPFVQPTGICSCLIYLNIPIYLSKPYPYFHVFQGITSRLYMKAHP